MLLVVSEWHPALGSGGTAAKGGGEGRRLHLGIQTTAGPMSAPCLCQVVGLPRKQWPPAGPINTARGFLPCGGAPLILYLRSQMRPARSGTHIALQFSLVASVAQQRPAARGRTAIALPNPVQGSVCGGTASLLIGTGGNSEIRAFTAQRAAADRYPRGSSRSAPCRAMPGRQQA